MDRKSILVIAVSVLLLLAWPFLVNRIYPPKRVPVTTNLVSGLTNEPAAVSNVAPVAPPPAEVTTATTVQPQVTNLWADAPPEKVLTLENDEAIYSFTSHGGGLKEVELKQYPRSVECRGKNQGTNGLASLNTEAPLPVMALLVGSEVLGDGVYQLQKTARGVQAEMTLSNGMRVVKEFALDTNYLITARVRLENQSQQPLPLPMQEWIVGTATPMAADDPMRYMGVYWSNGEKSTHVDHGWFANRTLGCFPGTPRFQYVGHATNVDWAASYNQFFTIGVMPKEPAADIVVRQINMPLPPAAPGDGNSRPPAPQHGYQTGLVYPGGSLAAGQSATREFHIYAGPKEYHTLARIGSRFHNNIDRVMGYSGFFGFFAKGLLLSMNGIHRLGIPYGLAIIVITIIIKTLFWPLTQASTRSMKRMAALQPEIKALQAKYKDDPAKMNKKMMELWKKHKVSPLGGCLPMFLQLPVFFGFYRMIQSAIELRGARFLWVCDLSKPDTLFVIPGLNFPVNPLPLIMGATMLWQSRLTPPSPGVDPVQQKIMRYMPLMFMFFLYNFSAGLTLYWTVQNLLTIAQMKLTKAKEEPPTPPGKAPEHAAAPKPKKK